MIQRNGNRKKERYSRKDQGFFSFIVRSMAITVIRGRRKRMLKTSKRRLCWGVREKRRRRAIRTEERKAEERVQAREREEGNE